ncbi:ATP/GTP-binding protein [Lentzea sp. NBRC 105346]|uniref:hypothetical protein n=1 Tax=Lentzea sp. NBRC 105346 TaxID=3032205 RepID=UPI0024A187E4|nr:hypothetical protein [Lentzea sp. NBRC 105346]GLZ30881.1 ATP/GTP-binding protein [Lentzea sp. NBRC 105346]
MLKRLGVVVGLSTAVVMATALPAFADPGWGFTDCSQYPNPGCELGAGKYPRPGDGNQGYGNKPGNPGQNNPGTGQANGDTIVGGNTNLAQCGYERSDYQGPPPGSAQPAAFRVPPKSDVVTAVPAVYRPQREPATVRFAVAQPRFAQAQPPPGAWYVYKCTGPGFRDALYRPPVWIADGQPGPVPLPSPAELAAQARNQLRLPAPKIKANPAGDQLVSLPTWLWLDRSSWGDVSATASVPGVSVTAFARPTSVTWSMGDGGSVTCTSPGSPFPAGGDPKSASPDCGYTYKTSSAGQRADAFPVTATVNWTVTWSGAGQSGTFPNMTTSASVAFRVAESQGIATG